MIKQIETSGKTIEDAINAALRELNCEREMVNVEVLEKPKSGFLGIGSSLAKIRVTYELSMKDKAEAFVEELLSRMGVDLAFSVSESEGELEINLSGEKKGMIIGRHGDTLDAVQHVTSFVVNRGEVKHVRVIVDAEGYRKRREMTLEKLAQRVAEKVVRFRKSQTLEPMNAYERHVIHAALQTNKDVTTHSVGMEPKRRVVVSLAQGPGEADKRPRRRRPPATQKQDTTNKTQGS